MVSRTGPGKVDGCGRQDLKLRSLGYELNEKAYLYLISIEITSAIPAAKRLHARYSFAQDYGNLALSFVPLASPFADYACNSQSR